VFLPDNRGDNMKKILIIGSIIVLYLIFAIFGLDFLENMTTRKIYIDTNTAWEYSNNSWANVYNNNIDLKKYNVYSLATFEYLGKLDLQFKNGDWYIKNNGKYSKYNDQLFAYKGNKIKVYQYNYIYAIADTNAISNILSKIGITKYDELNLAKKIVYDIDNDNIEEKIYVLSNVYAEDGNRKFSVIAVDDGGYIVVKYLLDVEENMLDILALVDVDDDKKIELIVVNNGFSLSGNTYSLHALKDGQYVELVSTN